MQAKCLYSLKIIRVAAADKMRHVSTALGAFRPARLSPLSLIVQAGVVYVIALVAVGSGRLAL